ncbi:MAG: hypothetical protein ABSA78_23420 [Candidatus Sulfotelmatobacter sp.]
MQSEFTEQILAARYFGKGPSRTMVRHLDRFIQDVFHFSKESDEWPELEDIFTFVDMSANTGHHLGSKYSPKQLRQIRRELLARTVRMLHQRFESAKKKKAPERKKLTSFLKSLRADESSFVSLNWDTSLERTLLETNPQMRFSYGSSIREACFSAHGQIELPRTEPNHELQIAKMHGSANWLYCDNCRRVFWFPPAETLRIADQIVGRRGDPSKCCFCDVELGTRIATFSYRKALDFSMFQRSWSLAESKLRSSKRWVFIGYSLPAADFEFKYLLKRVELARSEQPEIVAVTGGTDKAAIGRTLRNYQGLFGKFVKEGKTFLTEGLSDKVIARITS